MRSVNICCPCHISAQEKCHSDNLSGPSTKLVVVLPATELANCAMGKLNLNGLLLSLEIMFGSIELMP